MSWIIAACESSPPAVFMPRTNSPSWDGDTNVFNPLPNIQVSYDDQAGTGKGGGTIYIVSIEDAAFIVYAIGQFGGNSKSSSLGVTFGQTPNIACLIPISFGYTLTIILNNDIGISLKKGDKIKMIFGQSVVGGGNNEPTTVSLSVTVERSKSQPSGN